jgi:peptide deformylase
MQLIYYPNKILETQTEFVLEFDDELGKQLDEMKEIMLKNNGLGLAANQVGLNKRMLVLKTERGEIYELINPLILDVEGGVSMPEGCLSAPSIYLEIHRPASVMFQYQDRTGEIKKAMAQGIEARTILHEMDHLNGIFYFSKVSRQKRKTAKAKLRKILK